MNRKMVLLFSAILALLALVLMQFYRQNLAEELGVAGERVKILAARTDIPAYSVIERGQIWRYLEVFAPPPADWADPDFDDTEWAGAWSYQPWGAPPWGDLPEEMSDTAASWIWDNQLLAKETQFFRFYFELPAE